MLLENWGTVNRNCQWHSSDFHIRAHSKQPACQERECKVHTAESCAAEGTTFLREEPSIELRTTRSLSLGLSPTLPSHHLFKNVKNHLEPWKAAGPRPIVYG